MYVVRERAVKAAIMPKTTSLLESILMTISSLSKGTL